MQINENYREVLDEHTEGRNSVVASWIVLSVLFGLAALL